MSKSGKIISIIGGVIVVVGIGLAVGWWASSGTPSGPAPKANDAGGSASATPAAAQMQNPRPMPKPAAPRTNSIVSAASQSASNTTGIPDWEEKIDTILTSDIPDNQKAKKMLEMFPQLSPEAQEEVAHHLSNLVPDEEYAPLGNYLTNSALPEPVLDVLLEDVFNRPNSVKLPLLLDMARNPQHPKAQESKDVLELFLEEDYGNDWSKWQAKMDQWLKDNPD